MTPPIEFAKLSGSGNDFICIDNRGGRFDEILCDPSRVARFVRALCRRGLSVGADGVIFACLPEIDGVADIAARHFEPDGSEAELCGNGTACFTSWAKANGWSANDEVRILTSAGVVRGRNLPAAAGMPDPPGDPPGAYTRVCIPLPEGLKMDLELTVKGRCWVCDFAVTGVPHVVAYVDDVDKVDVPHWGPGFRHHERFAPRGANANFVQVLGEGRLAVRTWEFGVEGETLACGTGSASAAILAARRFGWPKQYLTGKQPVLVRARSGDVLRIHFTMEENGSVSDLCLDTVVRFVYVGRLHPDLAAQALCGRNL